MRMFAFPTKPALSILAMAMLLAVAVACAPASGTAAPTAGSIKGPGVGNVAPDFTMARPDGEKVTLAHLDAADQPAHLFFFASW